MGVIYVYGSQDPFATVLITVTGTAGDDTLIGTAAADSIAGGEGNDILSGGAGDDTLDGAGGWDTVDYRDATGHISVDLTISGLQDIGGGEGSDQLISIEYVIGSPYDDTIKGSLGDGKLDGGAGNDIIWGGAYNDTLNGGSGSNTLDGKGGTDAIELALTPADYWFGKNGASYWVIGQGVTNSMINIEQAVFDGPSFSAAGQALYLAQFMGQTFNALNYIASYPDLIRAFGDDQFFAAKHYFSNGIAEGRTVTFDPLAYIASYDDLIRAFGTDATAGAEHYIKNGFREGRSTSFNALNYVASYGDLIRAFGDNTADATWHYLKHGFAEGRTVTFDPLAYIASYKDLIGAFGDNATWGVEHYIHNGFSEGRTVTFDPVAYLINNSDLGSCGFTAADVVEHYIHNGFYEGRTTDGAFGSEQTNHAIAVGGSVSDTIGTTGDKDWFAVTLAAGHTYTFTVSGVDGGKGTLADPFLAVYNANGLVMTYDDNAATRDATITFVNAPAGTYYLVASASGSGTGSYTLNVSAG